MTPSNIQSTKPRLVEDYNTVDLFSAWVGHPRVPEKFLRWGIISALAGCLGSRVHVKWRGDGASIQTIYPNLYVLFVAPTGG